MTARDDVQAFDQGFCFAPAVGFDQCRHDIGVATPLLGGFKHGISLADAGGVAQENLELAALLVTGFFFKTGQDLIGGWKGCWVHAVASIRREPILYPGRRLVYGRLSRARLRLSTFT